jgi:hypothetical protein
MKRALAGMIAATLLTIATSTTHGESQLPLNEVVEPEVTKSFGHQSSVLMVDGFWAKAGSDVTLSIVDISDTVIQMTNPVPIPIPNVAPPRPPASLTDLTGSPGTGSVVVEIGDGVSLPNPASYYAVNSIWIQEKDDQPCLIRLYGRMVDPAFASTDRNLALFELEKCRSLSPRLDVKEAELPKSSDMFVRGVLACGGHIKITIPPIPEAHASLSWEIKGLKVRAGRVVPETDEVLPLDKSGEFVRPNCPEKSSSEAYGPGWTTWYDCPTGQVMTGVRAYRYEDKWFTGLKAICKTPQRSLPPRKPVKDALGF